jgi:hypothetical protein
MMSLQMLPSAFKSCNDDEYAVRGSAANVAAARNVVLLRQYSYGAVVLEYGY